MAVAIAAMGFVACEDKGTTNVPQEEAPETVSSSICEQAQNCGCFELLPTSVEMCKQEWQSEWQASIDASEAAGLTYDGECVGRALDLYGSLGCRAELDDDDLEWLDECASCKIFHGSKGVGEPCSLPEDDETLGDECAQGLWCDGEVCIDPCATAGEGEDCLNVRCAEGLECQYEIDPETGDATAICVEPAGEGEDCSNVSCGDGLVCRPDASFETQICVRPAGAGEDCSQLPCGNELVCAQDTSTCAPYPAAGEPCPQGICQEGAYCEMTDADPPNGVCVAQKGEGESCANDMECASWSCSEDGTCAPDLPIVCEIGDV